MTDSDTNPSPVQLRAEAAHAELLACVADAVADDCPSRGALLLADLVRCSAELRIVAEAALGRLLLAYPDPGGVVGSGGKTEARRIREAIGTNRASLTWLTQLGELDDALLGSVVDELWRVYPSAVKCGARSVVAWANPRGSILGDDSND